MRVDVDPRKLAARGIGIDEVASAISNANVNLPTGTMYGRADLRRAGQRAAAPGGGVRADDHRLPQRQSRCASRKSRTSTTASRTTRPPLVQGERAIILAVQKQPGTNVVAVVDAVKQLLPTFREQMPAAVDARYPHRSLDLHPRVGSRRQVHAAASRSASSSS